jgi:hypothetical protein
MQDEGRGRQQPRGCTTCGRGGGGGSSVAAAVTAAAAWQRVPCRGHGGLCVPAATPAITLYMNAPFTVPASVVTAGVETGVSSLRLVSRWWPDGAANWCAAVADAADASAAAATHSTRSRGSAVRHSAHRMTSALRPSSKEHSAGKVDRWRLRAGRVSQQAAHQLSTAARPRAGRRPPASCTKYGLARGQRARLRRRSAAKVTRAAECLAEGAAAARAEPPQGVTDAREPHRQPGRPHASRSADCATACTSTAPLGTRMVPPATQHTQAHAP